MRFHFAAGTKCQQAFQLMTLVKVCKAGLVICDYNIDNDVYDEDDDDNHGNDGDDDIYIMMKCVSVCNEK